MALYLIADALMGAFDEPIKVSDPLAIERQQTQPNRYQQAKTLTLLPRGRARNFKRLQRLYEGQEVVRMY